MEMQKEILNSPLSFQNNFQALYMIQEEINKLCIIVIKVNEKLNKTNQSLHRYQKPSSMNPKLKKGEFRGTC